jgi:hypothetical protein
MNTQVSQELRFFKDFVSEKLESGDAGLTPEEALDQWRSMNPDPEDLQQSVAAVRKALIDMENGDRGRPADDVLSDLRKRYQLPEM